MRQHSVQTPYMVGEAHYYSAEIGGSLVLFDTGPATPEALELLRAEIDLSRLGYIFITHCHVDHYGLAATLVKESGARLLIPRLDAVKLKRHRERLERMEGILKDCGFDGEFTATFRSIVDSKKILPTIPDSYEIVEESSVPEMLGIPWLSCPGHSQSDLVYCHGDWAVSGDILLRNIFQAPLLDVDLESFSGRFRNYDAYCDSLLKLATLRGRTILPGHRQGVKSVDDTILFYVTKMLERAGEVNKHDPAVSVSEVVARLFGGSLVDPFFVYLKASEIVFMRDFLAEPERLRRSLEEIGLFPAVAGLFSQVAP